MLLPSLFTAATLFAVYRFVINFTDLPYSNELRRPGSAQFVKISHQISDALQDVLSSLPGQPNVSVLDYRFFSFICSVIYVFLCFRNVYVFGLFCLFCMAQILILYMVFVNF